MNHHKTSLMDKIRIDNCHASTQDSLQPERLPIILASCNGFQTLWAISLITGCIHCQAARIASSQAATRNTLCLLQSATSSTAL
jgi:hypothetical protein